MSDPSSHFPDGCVRDELARLHVDRVAPGYSSHVFWSYPPDVRAYAILAAFDSFVIADAAVNQPGSNVDAPASFGQWQVRKLREEGFVYAMLQLAKLGFGQAAATSERRHIEGAGNLITLAADVAAFELWRTEAIAGIFRVERVNEGTFRMYPNRRRGAFFPPSSWLETGFSGAVAQDAIGDDEEVRFTPEVTLHSGHIDLMNETSLALFVQRSKPHPQPPTEAQLVDMESVVSGVSLDSFLKVHHALWHWSRVAMMAYLELTRRGAPQNECMPTQVVGGDRLARYIGRASGLNNATVRTCLEWMEYDPDDPRADPFLQPLLRSGPRYMWSVYTILQNHPLRNILKRLARDATTQNAAATIIGSRSARLARELARRLEAVGYTCHLEREMKSPLWHGEVDLLAWTPAEPEAVLLVECKAMLTPDSPLELVGVEREWAKAEQQLAKMRAAVLGSDPRVLLQRFPGIPWERVNKALGITCFLQGLPLHFGRDSEFPSCSLMLIDRRFTPEMLRTPSDIYLALSELNWIQRLDESELKWEPLRLGGLTIEQPIFPLASLRD